MTIYIAGSFESRKRLRHERDRLVALGHIVNSTWLDIADTFTYELPEQPHSYIARRNLSEIDAADTVILDTLDASTRGGREFEAGFTLGRRMAIVVVVGPARNVFHAILRRYNSWDDLLREVAQGWSR